MLEVIMSIGGFSPGVGRPVHVAIPAVISEGYDANTGAETISEAKLEGMHKETLWDSMEQQATKQLVIACKDGKTVTYEKGFFNRLLESKPVLADLTQFCTIEFSDGTELQEAKAKLLMCGDIFGTLLNGNTVEHETNLVSLPLIPQNDFQVILQAIENEVVDISTYSEDVRLAMDFLMFHPTELPEGVHGKKDWNARGVDVGHVPPPPKALLEALNEPCPIAKDGSKMIDTHVILWMPSTLNGEPIDVNNLEKMAQSDAFGENKMGYDFIYDPIRTDAAINQSLEGGYWLALYKKPVAGGQSFSDQKKYIADNCPGYEVPKTREVIACSFMQYGCSGDKKERILARENAVCYSRCEEEIEGYQVDVGSLDSSGLDVHYSCYDDYVYMGVCPVRKFF